MTKPFGTWVQYLCPQHALTAFAGWMANCRWPWLKNYLIRDFIKRYSVDLSLATLESVDDYPSFNHFFTRHLKPELRPIAPLPNQIASPVDGCLSQLGKIEKDQLFQAKGFYYDLDTLLGATSKTLTDTFYDGSFATLYLAPRDYHRVHMPFTGTLKETIYIPGDLFSVNSQTTRFVPKLFTRNERLVCIFETEAGPMAIILVAAMLVGGIETVWQQSPAHGKKITHQTFTNKPITLTKGAELGHFKMGSTVIILFANNKAEWSTEWSAEKTVQLGQALGNIR